MADQALHQAPTISSTFPNPPDFLWRDFTPDKVSRFEELKKTWQEEHPEAASSKAVALIADLPDDLRHLQPPPVPADGAWRLYGDLFTLTDELPTLEAMGVPRLVPSTAQANPSPSDANRDRALNLKRLAKSVLLNFLELVGAASLNPDAILEKAADIQNILINMHHGINEYRPHQARESLIQTMQARLDQIRAETAAVNAVTDKAKRVLEGLGSIEVPVCGGVEGTGGKKVGGEVVYDRGDEEMWDEAAGFA
ncbi:hypothetical protein VPNG_08926 [Cytospora leucostoma]|uniref:Mediator of RNA polymerase II transcription subunit 7 n=1 Tax=Cytospora leucostoma TaxID=1230097 RepID=A0A423VWV6_9PEZI|nr:hypothetical protein VPNG_08926 [Cytospora leucostoma]